MWNLFKRNDTNELIYKTEAYLQISKTNAWLPNRKRRQEDKSGTSVEYTHTTIYKKDNQQGPTVQHRELYPIFCDNLPI